MTVTGYAQWSTSLQYLLGIYEIEVVPLFIGLVTRQVEYDQIGPLWAEVDGLKSAVRGPERVLYQCRMQ